MAEILLTGTSELVAISDGSQYKTGMTVTGGAASQSYTDEGGALKFYPDWKEDANARPIFKPVVYDTTQNGSSAIGFETGMNKQKWYYNGTLIEWTADTQSGYYISSNANSPLAGLFRLNLTDSAHPTLTIIDNIPSAVSSGNDDYIEFVGYIADGMSSFEVVVGHDVRVSLLSGGVSYKVDLIFSSLLFDNNESTNDAISVDVGAVLGDAGYVKGIAAIRNKGYKLDFSKSAGVTVSPSQPTAAFTITANMVTGDALIVVELLDNSNQVVAAASEKIADPADPDQVVWQNVATKNGASRSIEKFVKSGETVTTTVKVMTRDGVTDVSKNYRFKNWKVFTGGGTDVTSSTNPPAQQSGLVTQDSSGHFTHSITYDQIVTHGAIKRVVTAFK